MLARAQALTEEHKHQVALSSVLSEYKMKLAFFQDQNHKNQQACKMAAKLSNAINFYDSGIIFAVSADPNEKSSMIEGNREKIASVQLQLQNLSIEIDANERSYLNKKPLDRLRSQRPYKKLKPIVDELRENETVMKAFQTNNDAINTASLESKTNPTMNLG